jgi:hypothetical protein
VLGVLFGDVRQMQAPRFPPPWTVKELNAACFVVRDSNGQQLAYVYFEDEPGRQSAGEAIEPLSHLFEWAWAFSSSTRRVAVGIPTIPCSTRRAWTQVRSRAAAAEMVANDGPLDGC